MLLLNNMVQIEDILDRNLQDSELVHPIDFVGVVGGGLESFLLGASISASRNQIFEGLEFAINLDASSLFDYRV